MWKVPATTDQRLMQFPLKKRILSPLIVVLVLFRPVLGFAGEPLKYELVKPDVVAERLNSAPKTNPERAAQIGTLFREAKCEPSQQPVAHSRQPNVICSLPGESDSVILVGGHLDKVSEGDGIVDDWSGASLLPTLYQSLAGSPRRHTFVFVAFTDEEVGLRGSDYYAKHLDPAFRKKIVAMVNLECLGLAPTKVWVHHSDPLLVSMLQMSATSLQLSLGGVNVENVGRDDTESFVPYKVPHITVHSVTQETLPILHSKKDTIQAINSEAYYDSYKLLAAYLSFLDVELTGEPGKTVHMGSSATSNK